MKATKAKTQDPIKGTTLKAANSRFNETSQQMYDRENAKNREEKGRDPKSTHNWGQAFKARAEGVKKGYVKQEYSPTTVRSEKLVAKDLNNLTRAREQSRKAPSEIKTKAPIPTSKKAVEIEQLKSSKKMKDEAMRKVTVSAPAKKKR
jgi:hypothetical protein